MGVVSESDSGEMLIEPTCVDVVVPARRMDIAFPDCWNA